MARILEIRKRTVDEVQALLAAAIERTATARAAREALEADLAALFDARSGIHSAQDLEERDAHRAHLRHRIVQATIAERAAATDEEARRSAVADARRELRKIELYVEGLDAREREDLERKEQRATDEAAARIARRGDPDAPDGAARE
jgi:flagellar export protein FliJ